MRVLQVVASVDEQMGGSTRAPLTVAQHLAKFGFRLRRLARVGFLPLGHGRYVGMPELELNPRCCLAACAAISF